MTDNEIKNWVLDQLQAHFNKSWDETPDTKAGSVKQPQFGQWQPIETAPKNPEPTILGIEGKIACVGWYSKLNDAWYNYCDKRIDATHWIPWPEPPKED